MAPTELYPYWHTLSLQDALPTGRRADLVRHVSACLRTVGIRCRQGAVRSAACLADETEKETASMYPVWRNAGGAGIGGGIGHSAPQAGFPIPRSEEHTSELQSQMSISYPIYCWK